MRAERLEGKSANAPSLRATKVLLIGLLVGCKVIAAHFFQEGNFEVGDHFLQEAKIPDGQAIKKPYEAMHSVLREVRDLMQVRPAMDCLSKQ